MTDVLRLPIQKIIDKLPHAYFNLGDTHDHWLATARAICTTDTFPKLVSRTFTLPSSGTEYRIAGMTKGAGMIHPNMATLLGIICTDAPIDPTPLHTMLSSAITKARNYFRRLCKRKKRAWVTEKLTSVSSTDMWAYQDWSKGIRQYPSPPISRGHNPHLLELDGAAALARHRPSRHLCLLGGHSSRMLRVVCVSERGQRRRQTHCVS